jgi:hypothetical protein
MIFTAGLLSAALLLAVVSAVHAHMPVQTDTDSIASMELIGE